MANHVAAKVGGWAFRDPITSTQITAIQEALLKTPNFSEGSSHALSGDMVLTDGGTAARNFAMRLSGELGSSLSHIWYLRGIMAMGGVGRIRPSFTVHSLSANTNMSIAQLGTLAAASSLNGAHRDITLNDTGAGVGDFAIVLNRDGVYNLTLIDSLTSNAATIKPAGIGIAFWSTQWYLGSGNFA